jgi:hypothetical protein
MLRVVLFNALLFLATGLQLAASCDEGGGGGSDTDAGTDSDSDTDTDTDTDSDGDSDEEPAASCAEMCAIGVPIECGDMSDWEESYCNENCAATYAYIGEECWELWLVAVTCGLNEDASYWFCDDDGTPDCDITPCQAEYDAFAACEY